VGAVGGGGGGAVGGAGEGAGAGTLSPAAAPPPPPPQELRPNPLRPLPARVCSSWRRRVFNRLGGDMVSAGVAGVDETERPRNKRQDLRPKRTLCACRPVFTRAGGSTGPGWPSGCWARPGCRPRRPPEAIKKHGNPPALQYASGLRTRCMRPRCSGAERRRTAWPGRAAGPAAAVWRYRCSRVCRPVPVARLSAAMTLGHKKLGGHVGLRRTAAWRPLRGQPNRMVRRMLRRREGCGTLR